MEIKYRKIKYKEIKYREIKYVQGNCKRVFESGHNEFDQ